MMPTLVVDAGNTRIKAALFAEGKLVEAFVFGLNQWQEWIQAATQKWEITGLMLSDVNGKLSEVLSKEQFSFPVYFLDQDTALPFANLYQSKQTLGADRKALVAGAMHLFPGENCLIIDAGTCVTYDLLNSSHEYLGGNICPGLHMRLQAMHTFTGKLPLANWQLPQNYYGDTTESCLLSGAYWGLCGEIESFIVRYSQDYPSIKVLLSGGDAELLAKSIKTSIFVNEHLLLYGLNKILTHHAE
jgi:type III pantothenate kinase